MGKAIYAHGCDGAIATGKCDLHNKKQQKTRIRRIYLSVLGFIYIVTELNYAH